MNSIAKIFLTITVLAALPISAFAKEKKARPPIVPWKKLPAVVQTAIQSNAAGGKVVEVSQPTGSGVSYYQAEVKGTDGIWRKVYVTDAGILMKVEPDNARNKRKRKPLFGTGPRSDAARFI